MPAKSRATKNGKKGKSSLSAAVQPKRREIGALVCLLMGIFSFLGFFTEEGWFIDFFRVFMRGIIGTGFYMTVPALLYCSFVLAFHRGRPVQMRVICSLIIPVLFGSLMHLIICSVQYNWEWSIIGKLYLDAAGPALSGGAFSGLLAMLFKTMFSTAGAVIVFIIGLTFLVLAALNITLASVIDMIKNRPIREYLPEADPPERETVYVERKPKKRKMFFDAEAPELPVKHEAAMTTNRAIDIPVDDPPKLPPERPSFFDNVPHTKRPDEVLREPEIVRNEAPFDGETGEPKKPQNKVSREEAEKAKAEVTETIERTLTESKSDPEVVKYVFPPVNLLTSAVPGGAVDGREEMSLNAKRLDTTIKSFGINADICNVTRGPSVTRYEVELEQGTKLNKLTNLADDIALSLGAAGVRIAPIPDKISIVGIEVPNKLVNIVSLREIIESNEFRNNSSKLTFAIGKDIAGNSVVGDIAKLPHLLIAGTTGSGKSVCMNSLILSILYKASPEEARLIMIDPKMIELGVYNGIPHLLIPVVTDPKKAAGALQWAVYEMMKRYKLFSEVGARDLATYNAHVSKLEDGQKLPQIVVLIDELADLMLVAAKEVEESICRVAQMGRASGMHIVIATQRPSADVITGLMKANIPSRIAFSVDSSLNSRIILDTTGAEKLVGKGDMLYAPIGSGKPLRVQGTFVTDREREDVIEFVKERGAASYSEELLDEMEKVSEGNNKDAPMPAAAPSGGQQPEPDEQYDELLPSAVEVFLETGQASVSLLQRRLKLGYSRAARIVDQMEECGIVGPFEGSKPRQMLITREQWRQQRGQDPDFEFRDEDE